MSLALSDNVQTALAELHEMWLVDPRTKLTFTEVLGAAGLKVMHPAMTRDWVARSPAHRTLSLSDIEDLEGNGLVGVDWGSSENGRRGELRFTQEGEAYLRRRATPPAPAASVGAAWEADVLPVLQAILELERTSDGGVSQDAINVALGRPPGDRATSRTLERLSRAGYLADELTVEQVDGPLSCRLSEKGLQQTAGWPGAFNTDLASLFLAAIEARIADPETPEDERGRLRRLRESAGEVSQGVVTALIAGVIKSHTGL